MSWETKEDLFKELSKQALLNRLHYLSVVAPRCDDDGDPLPYATWENCDHVVFSKTYDGHTLKQSDRNMRQFQDDVMAEDLRYGAAIGRVRCAGYYAFTLTPYLFYETRGPFILSSSNYEETYNNITELKQAVQSNANTINLPIYDTHYNVIGCVRPHHSHLYKREPVRKPQKYQAMQRVYDWYVINSCHV